jgi:ribonuclease HI
MKILCYCDGACSGNGTVNSYGGYAAIIHLHNGQVKTITGAVRNTTNQKMELMAAITALKVINTICEIPCEIIVITDSQYVVKGMSEWIHNWQKNGWKNAGGKPISNRELWLELSAVSQGHKVSFRWTRGHSDSEENNQCDKLAVEAREALQRESSNG